MNHPSIFVNGGVEKLIDAVASRLINFSIGKFSRPINHDIFFLIYDFFLDFSIIFITKSCCKLINFFVSTTSTIRFYHTPSSRSTIFVDFFARDFGISIVIRWLAQPLKNFYAFEFLIVIRQEMNFQTGNLIQLSHFVIRNFFISLRGEINRVGGLIKKMISLFFKKSLFYFQH